MNIVLQAIRVSFAILLFTNVHCQDGYSNQDIFHYQQTNGNQVETVTSQRDPSNHWTSSLNIQYHKSDNDKNNDRVEQGRSRKVYRIKNPFKKERDDNSGQQDINNVQDLGIGASNQYAAIQYSLPPAEFLQQMRAESQYYQQQQQQQQQQQLQQISTPAPNLGYTATPQPQYQYSTNTPSVYANDDQQSNQIPQIDTKIPQNFASNTNFQYNGANSYFMDNVQSTLSPSMLYLSTPLPSNQFIGTPTNTFVSSSLPMFLSSPPNLQQYVSSPIPQIQTGTADYVSSASSTIGSNSLNYNNNNQNRNLFVNHYDNSANGIRYPNNVNQDFQSKSTQSSITSTYQDPAQNSWHNVINSDTNAILKSSQDLSSPQYQNSPYDNNQQQSRPNPQDNINSETHRIGNVPSVNNAFMNAVQPDYQTLRNSKSNARHIEHENSQTKYSNGDYGWNLSDKKHGVSYDSHSSENYPRQNFGLQNNGAAISQMNIHMDISKPNNHEYISKGGSESLKVQEFALAADKSQDIMKQDKIYNNNYSSTLNTNNPYVTTANTYYNNEEKQKNMLYGDNSSSDGYGNAQSDLITASPFYYSNVIDNRAKQPFDHAKALKNIVPIDVSNVVQNSELRAKTAEGLDVSTGYNGHNYVNQQIEQNIKYYKPVSDSYYRDKNAGYGVNIKTKAEDNLSNLRKQPENNNFYGNSQSLDVPHSQVSIGYQDNVQSPAIIHQGILRPQSVIPLDLSSALKVNDIPYQLTRGLSNDAFRLHNSDFDQGGIPTSIPMRINQNLANHQLDVVSNILNNLHALNKRPILFGFKKPDVNSPTGGLLSTINGVRVANPFNVDLKLVADMLTGKPAVDETHVVSLGDQLSKTIPLKLDISQLQQVFMKNANAYNNLPLVNDGLGSLTIPYIDSYNNGRFPYQGVKYSRSQEEEESIPISESTNSHPIGAVVEQDEPNMVESNSEIDLTAQGDDSILNSFSEEKSKNRNSPHNRLIAEKPKPSNIHSARHLYQKKHANLHIDEPFALLKPPPPHRSRNKENRNIENYRRRRRVNKSKKSGILNNEALFETENSIKEEIRTVPTLLRPPPPIAEAKSDIVHED